MDDFFNFFLNFNFLTKFLTTYRSQLQVYTNFQIIQVKKIKNICHVCAMVQEDKIFMIKNKILTINKISKDTPHLLTWRFWRLACVCSKGGMGPLEPAY